MVVGAGRPTLEVQVQVQVADLHKGKEDSEASSAVILVEELVRGAGQGEQHLEVKLKHMH